MDDQQLIRYSRQILVPQVDLEGQVRLASAHVLIVGAGGLGSPCAIYLAAAGLGRITLCDFDSVDLSNLQRQILHNESRLGMNKAASGALTLTQVNPSCVVDAMVERADSDSLGEKISQVQVVVDCSDNFETRHLLNRLCVEFRIPLVSGAAIQTTGQLTVFDSRAKSSPCYACFLPEHTERAELDCASSGILGPVTGTIGAMQATEVIKLLVSGTSHLVGRVLLYDAWLCEWQSVDIVKKPGCLVCGA